ncbi:hypothetical protein [Schumannella soli]|uniref:Ig-like domain-containing protein n=1 Tax=Schumannella soli TaxID=2590779 RepID=A0A506XPG5_9MICO|nr:hypothetical protein [Schumannella soli]TPW74531.1 hypothetical protein FJ657_13085 [Schumannella soli]
MTRSARILAALALAGAAAIIAPVSVAQAAPLAPAAVGCGPVGYNQSSGGASVSCAGGNYQFRVVVKCNAIAPFPGWTKYSSWTSAGSIGINILFPASVFPSCPSPAAYQAWTQTV